MHKSRGLSIIEAMLATAILAISSLAVTYTVVAGQQQTYEGDKRLRVVRLGKDLLEEIISRSYADPSGSGVFGAEPDERSRSDFDDVDDYNGYSEASGHLLDPTGHAYGSADQDFTREVTVVACTETLQPWGRDITGKSVTVTVRSVRGEQWQFTRFIPEPSR